MLSSKFDDNIVAIIERIRI